MANAAPAGQPASFNAIAALLLAELHGRCGYSPRSSGCAPFRNALPPRFEVAEIISLQTVRDSPVTATKTNILHFVNICS